MNYPTEGTKHESLAMMADGRLNPVMMITHIGGLDSAAKTAIELDRIPGGKKLIYTHKKLELVALSDFAEREKSDPFNARLADI